MVKIPRLCCPHFACSAQMLEEHGELKGHGAMQYMGATS